MKKLLSLALSLLLACSLCTALAADYSDVFTNFDLRDSWTAATEITFTDTAVTINGGGAAADGTVVTITAPGVYKLQGSCADGQVLVEIDKAEKAQLVLAGLTLTCQSSAPLYVLSADKVSLTLAPDTVNTFTDGKAYTAAFEKQPNACICSRDDLVINGTGTLNVQGNFNNGIGTKNDLVINGTGTLNVQGNFNNGIGTKNDLRIAGGVITVSAVKNALKGNDSVVIQNGVITLTAGKDAIKADNEDKPDKGYVYIAGGDIRITAGDDAIQATQDVTITGGALTVTATGKAVNSKGSQNVASGVINGK